VPEPADQAVDATRRTRLAVERTYLAWWRTGLTAFAVGLGAGKVVPVIAETDAGWAYVAIGAAFTLLGSACLLYGWRRQRAVGRALDHGTYVPVDDRVTGAISGAGALLGLALVVLLLAGG